MSKNNFIDILNILSSVDFKLHLYFMLLHSTAFPYANYLLPLSLKNNNWGGAEALPYDHLYKL